MNTQAYQGVIQDHMRQRQMSLWNTITKLYEVENSLNTQVHTWIEEGTFAEKVRSRRSETKPAVLRDGTLAVPHCL